MYISNTNPFIQKSNVTYNVNLKGQKTNIGNNAITLRELFNRDVNDFVHITKNSINYIT